MGNGRVSNKNHAWADLVGGLIEPAQRVKGWWTDRDSMLPQAAKRADEEDAPCHLYVDNGGPELIVFTVQKIPRPESAEGQ